MKKIKAFVSGCWQYDVIHAAVYSVGLNMMIECLNRRSLLGLFQPFINPIVFFYNALIILLTMSIALFTKRKLFTYSVVSVLWLALALINFVVLYSRKTPFTAMDIYLLDDAIKVIPIYINVFQMILIGIGVCGVLAGLVLLWLKGPRQNKKINYLHSIIQSAAVGAILFATTNILLAVGQLNTHFGNLANSYKRYGFVYCFSCSVVNRGISRPNEYSPQHVGDIKITLDEGEGTENSKKTPNIIFLQLESFFDPTLVSGVSFTENPLPNFQRLVGEYSSGYLSVPCFGAGTANTEFEVQTGINLDDFGPGEYPYKTVLQSAICESAAYDLKNLGYSTHALHNNDGTFYGRNKVFSHLGYDTFTSIEYMYDLEYTPLGWAKDKILTGEIEKILDTTEGSDYIYTISVQGHGDYPSVMPEGYVPEIGVSGFFDGDAETAFQYYVNEIHEMDEFIGELTRMLEARDEETVLVMYGDHLPGFEFTDDRLVNGDIYQTQYVIWDNFDIPAEKRDVEAFQLSAYVFSKLGISEGYITKFHQKQNHSEDYLKNLKVLEYDILYGNHEIYGGTNPYQATDLKMGTDEIEVSRAYNYKDYICVEGKNFNDFSHVYINDREYETEIINGRLLRVVNTEVKAGDTVSVVQYGDDKIELSRVSLELKSVEDP